MDAAETLTKAAALLINKGWTQGEFARTQTGRACTSFSKRACAYCAVGAISRAAGFGNYETRERARTVLDSMFTERDTLAELNDEVAESGGEVALFFLLGAEIAKEG